MQVLDSGVRRVLWTGAATVTVKSAVVAVQAIQWGPYYFKDYSGMKYGAGNAALAIWKGHEATGLHVIVHRPPEDGGDLERHLKKSEQFTAQDLIDKYLVNIWGLAEGEVAVSFATNGYGCFGAYDSAKACFERYYSDREGNIPSVILHQAATFSLEIL